jgi:hypothetical protein
MPHDAGPRFATPQHHSCAGHFCVIQFVWCKLDAFQATGAATMAETLCSIIHTLRAVLHEWLMSSAGAVQQTSPGAISQQLVFA